MVRRVLLLISLLFSSVVFSQTAVQPAGAGTVESPYEIATLDNLYWLTQNSDKWNAEYVQTADIDAFPTSTWDAGKGYSPIGNSTTNFTGNYNGQGYKITGLTINRTGENYIGLFGLVIGSTIQNIGLENVSVTGGARLGALLGSGDQGALVRNCYATGEVSSSSRFSGGLIGYICSVYEMSYVKNCYCECNVTLKGSLKDYCGGLVGENLAYISNSYATGNIVGGLDRIGGLVGSSRSSGSIENCYALGSVEGNTNVGGLVGENSELSTKNSFWNVDTDGITGNVSGDNNFGATGKTTAELKNVATYTNTATAGLAKAWDFVANPNNDNLNEDLWNIDGARNDGYPYQTWQYATAPVLTTTLASSIANTSATFGGNVTSSGGAEVTERGIVFSSFNSNPTVGDLGVMNEVIGSGTGSFSSTISSLEEASTYFYRAYAKNMKGIAYGEVKRVTLKGQPVMSNALSFDGVDDYVKVTNNPTVQPTTAFTLEAWVKIKSNTHSEAIIDNGIAEGGTNAGGGYFLGLEVNGIKKFRAWTYNGPIYPDNRTVLTSKDEFELNKWYHVATVYNGSTYKMYVNGSEAASANLTGAINYTNVGEFGLHIGAYMDNNENYRFDGEIDEVRIWNDARTLSELRDNMMCSIDPTEANLVAYYRFNQGSGSNLIDLTSNSNDGILTNMNEETSWTDSESFNTWLGKASSAWDNAENWSDGVPTAGDNVGLYKWSEASECEISGNPVFNNLNVVSGATPVLSSPITVNGKLIVDGTLSLNGQIITLGENGYLSEGSGILSGNTGSIQTTRNLSNLTSENVAGLGAEITTLADMGSTTVIRQHTPGGSMGISRKYQIIPTNNAGLDATLVFHYYDTELNGLAESELMLFKSTDNAKWTEQFGSIVNTTENTLTLSGIDGFSYWTAASTGTGESLPVELSSLTATIVKGKIALSWETITEENNHGFEIERAALETGKDKIYEKIGFIEGNGNSNSVKVYSFTDSKPVEGKIVYRLKQIDFDGKYEYSKEIEVSYESVKEFSLDQNYPNPFNPTTNISFKLAESGKVSIKIFNAIGQEVAELVNKTMEAGRHEVTFNASNLPSGTYFCQMRAGSFTKTSKMLLIK